MANAHVTAHATGASLTMLYRLRPGPCDKSFGLHVARLAALPDELVRDAAAIAEELQRERAGRVAGEKRKREEGGGRECEKRPREGADVE